MEDIGNILNTRIELISKLTIFYLVYVVKSILESDGADRKPSNSQCGNHYQEDPEGAKKALQKGALFLGLAGLVTTAAERYPNDETDDKLLFF